MAWSQPNLETEWHQPPGTGGMVPANAAGIVTDGVTDNAAVLQALVNAVPAGGTITLPAGSIYYSKVIAVPAGVVVRGMGWSTRLVGPGFQHLGVANTFTDASIFLRDLWLDGTNYTDSGRGVDVLAVNDLVLDNVLIHGYSRQVVADQVQDLELRRGTRLVAKAGTSRTDACGTTNGSSTVTDTSIALTDAGKPVSGTGIPAVSYIGAVTPGASFTLVNERGEPVNATATNASVSLTVGGGTICGLWLPYGTDAHSSSYPSGSPFHVAVNPNGTITTNVVRVASYFNWNNNPSGWPIVDDAGLQHDFTDCQASYGRSTLRLCGTNSVGIRQCDWEFVTGATVTTAAVTSVGTSYQKASTLVIEPGNYFGCVPRTDTCGTTNGSATVTDTSCVAADAGNPVSGAGIPASTYIGTVTPGVSFTLVDASGVAVNATATNAAVSLVIGNGQIDCTHLDELIMLSNEFSQPSQAVVKNVQALTTLIGIGNVNNGTGTVLYDAIVKVSNGGVQVTADRTGDAVMRTNLQVFQVKANGSSTSAPQLDLTQNLSGAPSFGTNYGVARGQNGGIIINGASAEGVRTQIGGTDSNTLDDGSGLMKAKAGVQKGIAAPAYSASITPSAKAGDWQTVTVTNSTAFTINAPSNPPDSSHTQDLTIEIFNNSGGAMGAITWDAAFVFNGYSWTNPANGKKRAATFQWNGAKWVCVGVTGADY